MNICFRFLLFLLCFAVNLLCQNAVLVDGWRVDFSVLETTNTQTKVKYTFTRSNGAGTLERVVLGIPSCFPNIKPISVRFIPEGSGSVVTGPGGELRNVRTILTQAPYGILVRISNGTHSSYSLEVVWQGRYDTDGLVHVGVADIDPGPCAGQGCRGGESKVIYGIKCPQQVSGYCNASSIRGDFAIFVDTSKFVSEQSLQSIKSALKNFVINAGITNEPPIIGLGRFFYGMQNVENPNSHFCTINPQKNRCNNPFPTTRFAWDFYQATGRSEYLFSNFLSLTEPRDSYPSCRTLDGSDGDFDKNFPDPYFQLCMDYDGYPRVNYGMPNEPSNSFRAIEDGLLCTAGDPSVDSALRVADSVLRSGWGDPQTQNYIVLITSGRFVKTRSQIGSRCESTCFNEAAAQEAITVANEIKNNGTRIFVIQIHQPNDPDLENAYNCSADQKRRMEETLRGIASAGCYMSVNIENISQALNSVIQGTKRVYSCPAPSGNICSYNCATSSAGFGICEPVYCPTPTPTHTLTVTPTRTPTRTPTSTPTSTPTLTPTLTFTPTFTLTFTPTRTYTSTPTRTFTPTFTYTSTPTRTLTPTFTPTSTHTFTPTRTFTPTFTPTSTLTFTPTFTPTSTFTLTPTATFTFTPTPTESFCVRTTVNVEKRNLDHFLRATRRYIKKARAFMLGLSSNRAYHKNVEKAYTSAERKAQRVFSLAWTRIFGLPDVLIVVNTDGNCIAGCALRSWINEKNDIQNANSFIANQALSILKVKIPKKLNKKEKASFNKLRNDIQVRINKFKPYLDQRVPDIACSQG